MPWSLNELGEVVSDADGVSWADAVKQQRAQLSREARLASMYAELDAQEYEPIPEPRKKTPLEENGSELVKIVVGNEQDRALTASVVQAMDGISQRLAVTEQFNESIVAALQTMSEKETNVTVEAPSVTVEAPNVTVEPAQITVQPQEIKIEPNITVEAPNVTVRPEFITPAASGKKVTFTRDPLTQRVESAEIAEE